MGVDIGSTLQAAGYRTGLLGKYLNGYQPEGSRRRPTPTEPPALAPASSRRLGRVVRPATRTSEFGYTLTEAVDGGADGRPSTTGPASPTTSPTSLADRAVDFIDRAARPEALPDPDVRNPFALVVTPFATHQSARRSTDPDNLLDPPMFPAAPRDRTAATRRPADHLRAPGGLGDPISRRRLRRRPTRAGGGWLRRRPVPGPALGRLVQHAPRADAELAEATPAVDGRRDRQGAKRCALDRIRMLQSVSDLVDDVRAALEANGLADNTYLILTSDNGYASASTG